MITLFSVYSKSHHHGNRHNECQRLLFDKTNNGITTATTTMLFCFRLQITCFPRLLVVFSLAIERTCYTYQWPGLRGCASSLRAPDGHNLQQRAEPRRRPATGQFNIFSARPENRSDQCLFSGLVG